MSLQPEGEREIIFFHFQSYFSSTIVSLYSNSEKTFIVKSINSLSVIPRNCTPTFLFLSVALSV